MALLVFAWVRTVNFGLKDSVAQLAAWKRVDTNAEARCTLLIEALTARGLQLVGLNMNPGRSTVTFTVLICNGMPCRMVGNGSLAIVSAAV